GLDHKLRTNLQVVSLLVAFDLLQLRFLRRNQELKHKKTSIRTVEIIGQLSETVRLSPVQSLVALRVVSHQDFTECWLEDLDVVVEGFAVLEIELILSAFLNRARDHIAVRLGIA